MFKSPVSKFTILALLLLTLALPIGISKVEANAHVKREITLPNTSLGITSASLNMRRGAGVSYGKVITIPKGAKISVLKKESNGWLYVEYQSRKGYVSGKYVKLTPAAQVKSVPQTQSMRTTASLNMRQGTSSNYRVISTIPKGKEVRVLTRYNNGWARVSYGGKTGYVSVKYLTTKIADDVTSSISSALTMILPDKTLRFKNGGIANGQSIIDGNDSLISTWGGAEAFSGTDGKNTHFIGHNPGAFYGIWNYSIGSKITVIDHKGENTVYSITEKFLVDDNGIRLDTKENYYNYITSVRGGEVITLQTCKNDTENWIIRAKKVN